MATSPDGYELTPASEVQYAYVHQLLGNMGGVVLLHSYPACGLAAGWPLFEQKRAQRASAIG